MFATRSAWFTVTTLLSSTDFVYCVNSSAVLWATSK